MLRMQCMCCIHGSLAPDIRIYFIKLTDKFHFPSFSCVSPVCKQELYFLGLKYVEFIQMFMYTE